MPKGYTALLRVKLVCVVNYHYNLPERLSLLLWKPNVYKIL